MGNREDRMLLLIQQMAESVSLIRGGNELDCIDQLVEMVAQDEVDDSVSRNQLHSKIYELEHLLSVCHTERNSISCKLAMHESNKEKLKKLRGKRVGIIGGHTTDIRKIEAMLNCDLGILSKATAGEGSPPPYTALKEKYRNANLLIILNDYAGHALTGNAERLSDELGIPKVYDSADLLNAIKLKVIDALA